MKEYLATLFIDDRIIIKKMTDLLSQCKNGLLDSHLFESETEYDFPFSKLGESFCLDLSNTHSPLQAFFNGEHITARTIEHSDYITIKRPNGDILYNMLFVDCNNIRTNYLKYKLEINKKIFIGRSEKNDIFFNFNTCISREKHLVIWKDSSGDVYLEDLKRTIGIYVNGKRSNSIKLSLYDEIYCMGLSILYMGEYIAVKDLNVNCHLDGFSEFEQKEPLRSQGDKVNYFVRSPRILKSLDSGSYEIDPPTAAEKSKKMPLILTIGPSVTMSIAMITSLGFSITNLASGGSIQSVATSGVMAISMLLGSIFWPLLLMSYQKRKEKADENYRRKKYHQYITKKDTELSAKYERNTRIWNEVLSPNPEDLSGLLNSADKKLRLWERSINEEDFLSVRIGTGNRDFGINIDTPKDGFRLEDDDLFELPKSIAEKYKILKNVPITLSLKEQATIGFIGNRNNIINIGKEIILNIAALHSYDEVKMVFIHQEKDLEEFKWVRELPHTWSSDRSIRYIATNPAEVHQIFNAIDEIVKEREPKENEKKTDSTPIPHFVFFIMEESFIENESLLRYLENPMNSVGISSLFLYGNISKLPKDCSVIIQSDAAKSGFYSKNKNNNKFVSFSPDEIIQHNLQNFSNKLSNLPVKVDSKNLSIPNRVSFLQMYRTGNIAGLQIERHWNGNSSNKTLAAPIGVLAGGEIFSLDIHEAYHGCHGLVAGMTGSGKSEFLQAYILSLAIHYSPNEVAFVLVDFKGGDMARPFMEKAATAKTPYVPSIPHLSAVISNLSGNILYRALISFEAEIKTRQRIFNESAASLGIDKLDINSYHRYFKEGRLEVPLPHLIIVIDEFAQLKTQQPDFLAQLINVAQVGRSLGIHLILATQKPSGVVDPQIWSNSRFRVCLKVLDKQDSAEMINRPDAALIKLPGRCYVQVGYDEVFECLQSGYSGADYIPSNKYILEEEITVHMVDNTATPIRSAKDKIAGEKTGRTQLEEIVKEIVSIGQQKDLRVKPLWCEMLRAEIYLDDLKDYPNTVQNPYQLTGRIALVDSVRNQSQFPLEIDLFQTGHIALYGASGTGKTTFLQTLLYSLVMRYTPDEMNCYVLDLGGRALGYLNTLPHCGGVVFSDNEDGIVEVIETVQNIIEERKLLFESKNCGSFVEYLSASGQKLPAIILVVDNYAPFREKFYHLEEEFGDLISGGKAYGIFAVITGSSKNAIYYKVCEHISTFFVLRMNDNMNYRDILNVSVPIEPEDVKGRGITVIDGCVVEFQTALAVSGINESDRIQQICAKYKELANQWKGNMPITISGDTSIQKKQDAKDEPILKKESSRQSLQKRKANPPEPIESGEHSLVVGKSLSGLLLYGVEFAGFKELFVGGLEYNDLKLPLQFLLTQIAEYSNRQIILIDTEKEELMDFAQSIANCLYINASSGFNNFLIELNKTFEERRSNLSKADISAGKEVIYEAMCSYEKKFIVIYDFTEFYDMIADEDADLFTEIVRECDNMGIYFITAAYFDKLLPYNSLEIYKYLIKTEYGMICDGYIEMNYAGLLCDEMSDILISQNLKVMEGNYLFYENEKSIIVK